MDHVFDDLIGLQRARPRPNRRAIATVWVFRLGGNMAVGVAIGGDRGRIGPSGIRKRPPRFPQRALVREECRASPLPINNGTPRLAG